jgi:hypothetical protein
MFYCRAVTTMDTKMYNINRSTITFKNCNTNVRYKPERRDATGRDRNRVLGRRRIPLKTALEEHKDGEGDTLQQLSVLITRIKQVRKGENKQHGIIYKMNRGKRGQGRDPESRLLAH